MENYFSYILDPVTNDANEQLKEKEKRNKEQTKPRNIKNENFWVMDRPLYSPGIFRALPM